MKELLALGVIVLGCLFLRGAPRPITSEKEPAEPVWLTNYEQARKIARATGQPLFVVFRCEH